MREVRSGFRFSFSKTRTIFVRDVVLRWSCRTAYCFEESIASCKATKEDLRTAVTRVSVKETSAPTIQYGTCCG